MQISRLKKEKGFSLIELVVYVAGLVVLMTVMVALIVQFYKLYKEIVAIPRADRTGLLVVDQITKEIRVADQLDIVNSTFGSTNGKLQFNSIESGITITKKFSLENGVIRYTENGVDRGALSPKDIYVSNFNFALVQTSVSDAIRFTMELQFITKNGTETKAYSGFAILRESYE